MAGAGREGVLRLSGPVPPLSEGEVLALVAPVVRVLAVEPEPALRATCVHVALDEGADAASSLQALALALDGLPVRGVRVHVQALPVPYVAPTPTPASALSVSALGEAILDDPQVLAALLAAVDKGVADPMVTGMLALLQARSVHATTLPSPAPLETASDDDMEIDNDALLPSTLTIRSALPVALSDDVLPERPAKRARRVETVTLPMLSATVDDMGWEQPDEESERTFRLREARQLQHLQTMQMRREGLLKKAETALPPRQGASEERRLIVEHVAPHVTAEKLKRLFGTFGPVNVRLSQSQCSAHVVYRDRHAARLALEELNGALFEGRALAIRPITPNPPVLRGHNEHEALRGNPASPQTTPATPVRFNESVTPAPVRPGVDEGVEGEENPCIVLLQGLDGSWNTARIVQLFAECGTVRAMRSLFDPKKLTMRTYTLVEFSSPHEAARAVKILASHETLRCSIARGNIYFQTRELVAPSLAQQTEC